LPKQPWTVIATYDEDGTQFYAVVEARGAAEALRQAKLKADGIVLWSAAAIFEGKVKPVDLSNIADVVPLRGHGHEIEVTLIRVARRRVVIPARCPKCRRDLSRARSMIETYFTENSWAVHLAHDGKSVEHDRDGGTRGAASPAHELVQLACSSCSKLIWEGKHVEA
jgi:hypothetical protein